MALHRVVPPCDAMPRREDIRTILVLGSGPIVIGQGCEFDYSGTQACKALRSEGYRIVLVNSNPATIMTDPQQADVTYVEPLTAESVTRVIEAEASGSHPVDALLPTMGGQTALNLACALHDSGVLARFGVEMIGATRDAIYRAEDREQFRRVVESIGLRCARCGTAGTLDEARVLRDRLGLPAVIRPAFTLGGTGGGIARTDAEFEEIVARGLDASMNRQVLIDESLLGWKEYELEVIRDRNDNCIVVCGIENLDPMGVHTGDSITVCPIMTLTDREYQRMRDAAIAILRAVGVETGGSNVQFAVNPSNGDMVVVEMNPRVSRSSALASKATGYPIAKVAARLAVGYTLDELPNDITRTTSACFEPTIDYVVVKMPRWTFEKFPEADETLTTQMKSVGEAMAIGRTFKEALQKAIRSMEVKRFGLGLDAEDLWLRARHVGHASRAGGAEGRASDVLARPAALGTASWPIQEEKLLRKLAVPGQGRLHFVRYALRAGMPAARVAALTRIDPWFIGQVAELCEMEDRLLAHGALEAVPVELLGQAKRMGYSDAQLAMAFLGEITTDTILAVRAHRTRLGVVPTYRMVDTCAAEFEAVTPYYYSTYEAPSRQSDGRLVVEDELRVSPAPKCVILGGGPNRIGQGIEFDYCCCQASYACRDAGIESVMINSNPETVSTDYDTSGVLFFEPLTLEDVLNAVERLSSGSGSVEGVIVQLGGQTPLNLADGIERAGWRILGTSTASMHVASDRQAFSAMISELGLREPSNGMASDLAGAKRVASSLGYPVLLRPSHVLGGRGMEICAVEADVDRFMREAVRATDRLSAAGHPSPIRVDHFLKGATEVDVDCVADWTVDGTHGGCMICGVMEHIEEAGIHSGDSSCAIPPYSLSPALVDELRECTERIARRIRLCGLMNIQYAVKDGVVHVLEVNPRASRTVPFVSKATGIPWARIASRLMLGERLRDLAAEFRIGCPNAQASVAVKASVFPFSKFPGVDVILGPEMRSTGEVMGIDSSFGIAFAKSQMAAGEALPMNGSVLLSVSDADKPHIGMIGRSFHDLGFRIFATTGTRAALARHGVDSALVSKSPDPEVPFLLDMIRTRALALMINTPLYTGSRYDEGRWRAAAVMHRVPLITTITGARAAVAAIAAMRSGAWGVRPLQRYFAARGAV